MIRSIVRVLSLLLFLGPAGASPAEKPAIDRRELLTRHNVQLCQADVFSPLSIGNGRFCFTADITGLQTFETEYAAGIPTATMADWAWHTIPNPEHYTLEDTFVEVDTQGRQVTYPIRTNLPAATWLRSNPHRFSLARIGLVLQTADGASAKLAELVDIDQTLDLWSGLLTSRFTFAGEPVTVRTCVPGAWDAVAVRVDSALLAGEQAAVSIAFAYPSAEWGPTLNDWQGDDRHQTAIVERQPNRWRLARRLDDTRYGCTMYSNGAVVRQTGPHRFILTAPEKANTLEFVLLFTPDAPDAPDAQGASDAPAALGFDECRAAGADQMQNYWTTAGAIDLSASTDPRWKELERRIVLSQYLTAIQGRGSYPPQETGLTGNSWYGKFHLEMHWWHSVHFALWGRPEVLEQQLQWYLRVMPQMRATARRQGYQGVRWGKMLGPDGRESPSGVGPLLLWQQPHPIYYAELMYRQRGRQRSLDAYRDLVFETARFMADFARWNPQRRVYELGPPVISAREFLGRQYAQNGNPAFELAYWRWGLTMANQWRRRCGLDIEPAWKQVAENLAPLPTADGIYIEQERLLAPDGGHPAMLACWGFLPKSPLVDDQTMTRTMEHVLRHWPRESTWGWDYPLMAMTAARIGRPYWAIESLLLDAPKNTYLPNGHNHQRRNLPLYLPGNGGLLTAAAMMAAGWDDGPERNAPGFPDDGTWTVRWEGLEKMP
ncbi:MAG: hypothetical protein JW810_05055 [Sedimentisphaerales bacterium]|nr:hypothetical protein [Sedimentisphaerales bacterium]